MAVTEDDVRHIAELARLAVPPSTLGALVAELNGILTHMDVLTAVDTSAVEHVFSTPIEGTPLRSDSSGPLELFSARETFAPAMRDGFYLVPRLATHDDSSNTAP